MGAAVTLWVLLVCLLPGHALALDRGSPVRIGALTVSWGPPPGVVGLIEGLVETGYRENEDFVIGVRFTQGDMSALPAAAREMVRDGVDIIFCVGESEAKAAQQATTTNPIVFAAGDLRSYLLDQEDRAIERVPSLIRPAGGALEPAGNGESVPLRVERSDLPSDGH